MDHSPLAPVPVSDPNIPASEALTFPPDLATRFAPHLPQPLGSDHDDKRPFVTLTFATSLDSALSLAPGQRTTLSGPASKAMTHYLRSQHAAILVGVGTAVADDPGLNCRIASSAAASPRPIILDPRARWDPKPTAKVFQLAAAGKGLAPYILYGEGEGMTTGPSPQQLSLLEQHGGKYVPVSVDASTGRFRWPEVLAAIRREGLESVMVEGGGEVINSLLRAPENELVDSVIVTIAPTWLGRGGVVVSPERTVDGDGNPSSPVRLTGVEWYPLGEDIVLGGKILR